MTAAGRAEIDSSCTYLLRPPASQQLMAGLTGLDKAFTLVCNALERPGGSWVSISSQKAEESA